MDFTAFDTQKIDEYAKRAKEQWGKTPQHQEFEEKAKNRTKEDDKKLMNDVMQLFVEFGSMKDLNPASEEPQKQVKKLQEFINEHFYYCTNEILYSLGGMYSGGGEFTENIDAVGGAGTAQFSAEAIRIYCGK